MSDLLTNKWVSVPLRMLLTHFESGKRPKGGVAKYTEGIRSLGGEHLAPNGRLRNRNMRFVPQTYANTLEKVSVLEDDILIVKDGATTGKTCLAQKQFAGSVINEHLFQARPVDGMIPRFLFYFLWSREGNIQILKDFRGSAQGGITKAVLDVCEVPVAPLNEQHRIVEKIETLFARLDKGEEAVRAVQKSLTRYRQSVLKAAVTGELTADWRAEREGQLEKGSDLLARILKERSEKWEGRGKYKEPAEPDTKDLPELPEGWVWASLGQLFAVYGGATPSRREPENWNGSIPWVSSGEVAFSRIADTNEKITEVGYEGCSTKLHPPGTVLLAMIGEGKTRGQAAILNIAACNNQNVAAIRVSETDIPPEFVYFNLVRNYEANRLQGQGGNQPALNGAKVKGFNVPISSIEEMREIVSLVEEQLSSIDVTKLWCETELKRSASLRQSILKDAYSGKLVEQDPNDEPASELLARIKKNKETV